jgi:hypothetical protein
MANPKGNPAMVKGGPSMNPAGRTPGPTLPTLILKDAYLLAAQQAGGGGPNGLVDYLAEKAETHPAAFLSGLSRIIPIEVEAKGDGRIIIEVIQRFDDKPGDDAKLIEHKANGHANGNGANGHKDPEEAAEYLAAARIPKEPLSLSQWRR